jgi:hypothetical protein
MEDRIEDSDVLCCPACRWEGTIREITPRGSEAFQIFLCPAPGNKKGRCGEFLAYQNMVGEKLLYQGKKIERISA